MPHTRLGEGPGRRPAHPETIAQLALAYTGRNRLVEAADSTSGWRRSPAGRWGRAEPGRPALRTERPGGCLEILRQALAATRRARSPRASWPVIASYWPGVCSGRQARRGARRLNGLLAGPDPEASWLLSRAFLQEGDRARASSAALNSRAPIEPTIRWTWNPVPTSARTGASSAIGTSPGRITGAVSPRLSSAGSSSWTCPIPTHPFPTRPIPRSRMFRKADGKVRVETKVDDKIFRAVVDYAFGSPDRYVSLVGHDQPGHSHILRLSHYQHGPNNAGWVRTTGHTADAEGGRDFLGKPMDEADGVLKCLFCHTTNPQAMLCGTGPESNDRAIGCEHATVPGATTSRPSRPSSPTWRSSARPRARAKGACALCPVPRLAPGPQVPRTDFFWIRFQGTTLPWSRCYTESGGASTA